MRIMTVLLLIALLVAACAAGALAAPSIVLACRKTVTYDYAGVRIGPDGTVTVRGECAHQRCGEIVLTPLQTQALIRALTGNALTWKGQP